MTAPGQEPTLTELTERLQSGEVTFLGNIFKPENMPSSMAVVGLKDAETHLREYRQRYGDQAIIVGDAHDRETQSHKAQADMIGVYVTTQAYEATRRTERKNWLDETTTEFLDKVKLDPKVVEDSAPTVKKLINEEVAEPEKGFDEDQGQEEGFYRALSINVASPTALLATMFTTGHEALPKRWKDDPEVARRLLIATAQVEAGLKQAHRLLAPYDSPDRSALEYDAKILDEYAKALDIQLTPDW